ncbi:MAG: hypothetical protein ABEK50_16900 [bacterium]
MTLDDQSPDDELALVVSPVTLGDDDDASTNLAIIEGFFKTDSE